MLAFPPLFSAHRLNQINTKVDLEGYAVLTTEKLIRLSDNKMACVKQLFPVGIGNMVRRSRLEIYFDILEVISGGVTKPTQIMSKTNLSWVTLQEMFETLTSCSFIRTEIEEGALRYYIADKGQNALAYHLKSLEGLVNVKKYASLLASI